MRKYHFVFNCDYCGRFSSERRGGRYIVCTSSEGWSESEMAVCDKCRKTCGLQSAYEIARYWFSVYDRGRTISYRRMVRARNAFLAGRCSDSREWTAWSCMSMECEREVSSWYRR